MAKSTSKTGIVAKGSNIGKIGHRSHGVAYNLTFDVWMTLFEEIKEKHCILRVAKKYNIKRQSLSKKYYNYIHNNVNPSLDSRGVCKKIFSVQEELNIFDQLWLSAFTIGFKNAFSNDSLFSVANSVYEMKSDDEKKLPFARSIGWANGFRNRHGIYITNGKRNYYNWEVLF